MPEDIYCKKSPSMAAGKRMRVHFFDCLHRNITMMLSVFSLEFLLYCLCSIIEASEGRQQMLNYSHFNKFAIIFVLVDLIKKYHMVRDCN